MSFSAPYSNVAHPDHDEWLATNTYLRYQYKHIADREWVFPGGMTADLSPWRLPTFKNSAAYRDDDAQLGLFCGSTVATVAQPIRACPISSLGTTLIRVPASGTENDDKKPSRIVPRNVFDLSFGEDNLFQHEKQRIDFHLDIVNLTNNDGL